MLKQRIISGFLMAILMAVIFLANEFWFTVILLATAVAGWIEILSTSNFFDFHSS